MDTLRIELRASRMLSGCDTTTPCALHNNLKTHLLLNITCQNSSTMRQNITITDVLSISPTNRSIATISNRLNRLAQGIPKQHLSWLAITRLLSLVCGQPSHAGSRCTSGLLRSRKPYFSLTPCVGRQRTVQASATPASFCASFVVPFESSRVRSCSSLNLLS